jgi:serine protease Do
MTPTAGAPDSRQPLGFVATELTPALAARLGLQVSQGVVVTEVSPYDAAAAAGLRAGQVIRSINGQSVTSLEDLQRVGSAIGAGEVVSIRVLDPQVGETILNFRSRG